MTSRKSVRKSNRHTRKSVRKSDRHTRKSVRKSGSKDDEKIKKYFRSKLKSHKDYLLGSVWINPVSEKQVKVSDKAKRLFQEVKKELGVKGKRCNVKKSSTNKREDLIKELKAYVKCWEKQTGRYQDLSDERLKTETLSDIKKHLKFYRDNNDL